MRCHELTLKRSFAVAFEHGEDFFTALAEFCHHNGVRQGWVASFIAGFNDVPRTRPVRRAPPAVGLDAHEP